MPEETALTIQSPYLPAVAADSLLTPEDLAEQLDGVNLSYPRVKIPAGGILQFELANPDDPDTPKYEAKLTGVIVDHFASNVFWKDPEAANGAQPDCAAPDGKTGYGDPGGDCAKCPLNEFGSGEGGNGKACKNTRRIYLLRPGDLIPLVIVLPGTSLRSFEDYLAQTLLARGIHPSTVVTQIGLKKQTSRDKKDYSMATFSVAERLPDMETAKAVLAHAKSIKAQIRATEQQPRVQAPSKVPDGFTEVCGEKLPF